MTFLVRIMLGTAGLTAALTFAWAVAFMTWAHKHASTEPAIAPAPITVRRTPDAVMAAPSAERETPHAGQSPYVGSIRTDSRVYHRSGCTKYDIKYAKPYWSVAEAEADGRRPAICSCFTPQIARAK